MGKGISTSLRKTHMAKLVLGKTPSNFKPINVKFVGPDGEDDSIKVTFKYKTRTQFAAFLNKLFESNKAETKTDATEIDFVELYKKSGDKTVEQLTEIIAEWDFAEPATAESLRQLHDQAPAAAAAITSAYASACNEGRLGN